MGGIHMHTLEDTFTGMDENGDGTVSSTEFKNAMHNLGFRLNSTQLDNLVGYIDADGSGASVALTPVTLISSYKPDTSAWHPGTINYAEFVTQVSTSTFPSPNLFFIGTETPYRASDHTTKLRRATW